MTILLSFRGSKQKRRRVLLKAKDIIDTTVAKKIFIDSADIQSNPAEGENPNAPTNTDGLTYPKESVFNKEPIISLSSESSEPPSPKFRTCWYVLGNGSHNCPISWHWFYKSCFSSDQDPQEPDSQSESAIISGHVP